MADTVRFRRCDLTQSILKCCKALLIERVENVLSLSPVIDDTGLNEHPHIVGKSRLGDVERLKDFAGTQFPTGEHIHNAQTLRVGDRL